MYWPAGTVPDPTCYIDGALVRWTHTSILPLGGVTSADILFGHLYAQMKGQPGTLPEDALPLGLTATEYHRNDEPFVDRAGGLVVIMGAAGEPRLRAVRA